MWGTTLGFPPRFVSPPDPSAGGLAVPTGFEPAISALTGRRVKPGYTTGPYELLPRAPNGIRTRAAGLKGRYPRPLDDGGCHHTPPTRGPATQYSRSPTAIPDPPSSTRSVPPPDRQARSSPASADGRTGPTGFPVGPRTARSMSPGPPAWVPRSSSHPASPPAPGTSAGRPPE